MENSCINCKFYEPYPRKIRYQKGHCKKQFAYRLSDKYKLFLHIINPYEYICDLYEPAPQPVYAIVEEQSYLVPPEVADSLIAQGWVFVKHDTIKKEE